jgi:hypothetical protein
LHHATEQQQDYLAEDEEAAVVTRRRRNQVNPIYQKRYVLFVVDHSHGERNGNVVGMKLLVVRRLAIRRDDQ